MERNRVLEAHETATEFMELYRNGLAGDLKAQAVLIQRYPRFKKIITAYDQALDLSKVSIQSENVAPCRQVALRAAQDLTDRLIGCPTEHVEVVGGLREFHATLAIAIQIEARLKQLDEN